MTANGVADQVDVLVVGCGTTGLALVRLLELEGLRVAAVERGRLPLSFPRATKLDDETMRAWQTLGLGHLEKTFSLVGAYRFYDAAWHVVMEMDLNGGLTEQGWQSDYMFHQPDFEAVLRGYAQNDPNTSTYFGWELLSLEDSGDEVLADIRELSTGGRRQIRAGFVVGADGASSPVRKMMGIDQIDYHATHRQLITDLVPFVENDSLPGRDCFIQGGIRNPLTFVPIAEPRLRFELMLRPDDDAAEFEQTEKAAEMLAPWFTPDQYRLLRSDVYEWRSLIADPWRVGRVLVAGDAAHTMPPHLGQGMCSGIRDATGLAWKLKRVVRGESPIGLLDTYETERSPHVETYVVLAAQMANQIENMETPTAPAEGEPEKTELEPLRPRIGPGVRAEDSDQLAGTLSPQPKLGDGRLMDDAVGYRFAVVGDVASLDEITDDTKARLKRLDAVVLREPAGELPDWIAGRGVSAVIVRPDRYIYGSARSGTELDALVSKLDGTLTASTVATP
jgi:3-(3-hydroxy-phenyl)propionate hydroxylase